MDLGGLMWSIIPAGVFTSIGIGAYRFYSRHLLDIEMNTDSDHSYCYVPDGERYTSKGKLLYYAHLKATVDISAGAGLGLQDVHFLLKDDKGLFQVNLSSPHAPQSIREFFGKERQGDCADGTRKAQEALGAKNGGLYGYGKKWQVECADGAWKTHDAPALGAKKRLTAQGVAVQAGEAFRNLPDGGYPVFIVLELRRFSVLVPCRFATLGAGESTICGAAMVRERRGRNLNLMELSKDEKDALRGDESLFRLRLAILDFDFLPWIAPFKVVRIKK